MNPEFSEVVLETESGGLGNADELPLKTLPEVKTVEIGLKVGVDLFNTRAVVRNREEAVRSSVQRRKEPCWGRPVLSKNKGSNRVAGGDDGDVGGVRELGQEEIIGP